MLPLDEDDAGFVVCTIPRSLNRPHMSTAAGENRYYRRSFSGNLLMTPGEIRDQILAVRDAILEPVIQPVAGGSFTNHGGWISACIAISLSLKNVGRALCRNPFLRARASSPLHSHSATYDDALQAWKTEFPDGTFIHVEDQKSCLSLSFYACIRFDILLLRFQQSLPMLTEAVLILPGSQDFRVDTISDKESLDRVELVLRYGAENAAAAETSVKLTREVLAKQILEQATVRDMTLQTLGQYRTDLVAAFANQAD
jgi:hypothetical protein